MTPLLAGSRARVSCEKVQRLDHKTHLRAWSQAAPLQNPVFDVGALLAAPCIYTHSTIIIIANKIFWDFDKATKFVQNSVLRDVCTRQPLYIGEIFFSSARNIFSN